ncbi:hypothetical protein CK203_053562 [Vitis vinifera]|uniref:EF-hand domain-containing protein n=1 Tax=Vitis vinifera TaxID=29760 RepID=A0A438HI32_VITVI|nr:hypothetical protein CK203_053562 [Vitis vinifera]
MASEGSSYLFLRFSSKGRSTSHDYGSKGRMESSQGSWKIPFCPWLKKVIPVGEAAKGSNLPEFAVAKLEVAMCTQARAMSAWASSACSMAMPPMPRDTMLKRNALHLLVPCFAFIHYDRIGEDGFFSHKEVTVLFVPDLSGCLPSLDTWRDQWLAHKKAVAERTCQLSLKREDGKTIEKKESGGTAGSQTSGNAKSGKKKIVKKVVKQKVADKKAGTENTENEENDKLDDKDVGEKNAKLETKSQQQEPSADPGVKTFTRKKVGKKVTEGKTTQDESVQPEVKIENEAQCSEDKSEIKSDPSIAASVQGTVQQGTETKDVSEQTVEAGNPVCEPKILEKKMTPKTKSKTATFSKQDEKTGSGTKVEIKSKTANFSKQDEKIISGTKVEIEAEKQKVPQKDSQNGNRDKSKDQEKLKDEKEKKEKDGKYDSRGNKPDKEAKEKKNLEEPPRHPGLLLQTKWSKDSKLRSLSLSLDSLLGYTDKDIEEPTFELSLFAETLYEMLQYQMGCRLLTFLQKLRIKFVMKRNQRKRQWEETSEKGSDKRSSTKRQKIAEPSMGMKSTESEMLDAAHPNDEKPATKGKSTSVDVVKLEKPKEEGVEPERLKDEGNNEELNIQNNEGEAKASGDTEPEKVAGMGKEEAEEFGKEKTNNKTSGTNEGTNLGEERKEAPIINKVAVDKELLQAFRFFDRNRVGYIRVEDMRLIVHNLGNFLSHRDVKELVQSALLESNTGRDDRILYNKLVRMSNI